MSWDPTCNSVGVHVNTPADVMVAPSGNVPSNENVKVCSGSKGELYTTSVTDGCSTGAKVSSTVTVNVSESCALVTDGIQHRSHVDLVYSHRDGTSQNLSGCRLSPEPLWCGLRPATQSGST